MLLRSSLRSGFHPTRLISSPKPCLAEIYLLARASIYGFRDLINTSDYAPGALGKRLQFSPTIQIMYAVEASGRGGWEAVGTLIKERQEQLAAQRQAGGGIGASETSKLRSVQGASDSKEPKKTGEDTQAPGELTEGEKEVVEQLKDRDREVRAHEQAHAAVGGEYAGTPSYTFQAGPDGKQYAIGGEVPIDVSPVDGDPEATIEKMRIVIAAALAPAEPSPQDRKIAALAQSQQSQAFAELMRQRNEARTGEAYDKRL